MTITTRSFDVTPAQLYAVIVDPETYPNWLTGTKKIRKVDANWPEKGANFHHTVGFGPIAIPDKTSSLGTVPDRSLDLIVRARPMIEAHVTFRIEPAAGGSLLVLEEDPIGPFRLAAPVMAPLIKARNERSLDRLQKVIGAYTWKTAD